MNERKIVLTGLNDTSDMFYKNPLEINQIGDPFVLKASNGKYYCYPTSSNSGYKVWSSNNLVDWKDEGYAYKIGEKTWGGSDFWAPEVVEYQGKYYMYYTARWQKNNSLRIGVAVSDNPTGPFKDVYDRPMFDFGYAAIDANVFMDEDGAKYLYFSRDCSENVVDGRHESHIYGILLNDDMVSVKGEPVLLTRPEQEWELASGPEWLWNEGATVFKRNGIYYLMYSANCYDSSLYSIGYATAAHPLGPYKKYQHNPIVHTDWEEISGPGHNSITRSPDGSEWFIVYHTHTNPIVGGGNRQVCIDRMGFRKDGSIYVNGPTLTVQPAPSSNSDEYNIAPKAYITVSSTTAGYSTDVITDGEISVFERTEKNEWISGSDTQVWVKLEWDKKYVINRILLYDSAFSQREITKGKVIFSSGGVIENVTFPEEPGAAAILCFPEEEVEWIKFIIEEENGPSKEVGISEIMVFGREKS